MKKQYETPSVNLIGPASRLIQTGGPSGWDAICLPQPADALASNLEEE